MTRGNYKYHYQKSKGIQDVTVVALIPNWPTQFDFTGWEKLEDYPHGTILFQHPDGISAGPTQWNTLLLRLKTI